MWMHVMYTLDVLRNGPLIFFCFCCTHKTMCHLLWIQTPAKLWYLLVWSSTTVNYCGPNGTLRHIAMTTPATRKCLGLIVKWLSVNVKSDDSLRLLSVVPTLLSLLYIKESTKYTTTMIMKTYGNIHFFFAVTTSTVSEWVCDVSDLQTVVAVLHHKVLQESELGLSRVASQHGHRGRELLAWPLQIGQERQRAVERHLHLPIKSTINLS